MRLIVKLIIAQYRRHFVRTLLVLGALTCAVAMVVAVVGGQSVGAGNGSPEVDPRPLGTYDAKVTAGAPEIVEAYDHRAGILAPLPGFDASVAQWITAMPQVGKAEFYGRMKAESWVAGEMFTNPMYRPGQAARSQVMGTDADTPPGRLLDGRWLAADGDDEVVIDDALSRRLGGVGKTFTLTTSAGRFEVRIAGVLETSPTQLKALPPARGRGASDEGSRRRGGGRRRVFVAGGVYVSPSFYERVSGQPLQPNFAVVRLAAGADEEDFSDAVITHSRRAGMPVAVKTTSQLVEEAESRGVMPRRRRGGFFPILADAGMKLAILAALFIIFNTFAMGVQERSRQLAMLRAIGLTRRQVVCVVGLEAFILAVLGWAVGVFLGWHLLRLGLAGAAASSVGVIPPAMFFALGAIAAFGATALAVAFPTVLAASRRPLEGLTLGPAPLRSSSPWWLAALAAPLVALGPVAAYTDIIPEPARTNVCTPLSVVTAMAGFAMLTPMFIVVCERLFAGIAGCVFGVNRRLLSKRMSASLWQTVGCTTALMVGLGLYIIVQVWGQSMLSLFVVPDRRPDTVVTLFPEGLDDDKLGELSGLPGVKAALPMILEHPAVAGEYPGVRFGGLFARDVILLGCDAEGLLGERDGMFASSFVRGNPEAAYAALETGRACLITDSFFVKAPEHFDVGKTIMLESVEPPHQEMEYMIAGVVEMHGWQMMSKSANMRRGLGRTGGIVLVSPETVRADFPDAQYQTLWFTLQDGARSADLENPIIKLLDPNAKPLAAAPSAAAAASGREGAAPRRVSTRQAAATPPRLDSRFYCRVTDIDAMTASVDRRAQGIIWSMTYYPLLALGLASLAVVSTMMMSIRTRSWEMGILRSIGLTRGQLLRHVIAEGLLVGLLACAVSLAMGLLTSTASIAATSRGMGVTATYVIPWKLIALGLATALGVSVLAGVGPAIFVARQKPLALLQGGRSAR